MSRIKLFIASSLDGYIARPDGSVDWLLTGADYGYQDFYDSIDIVLMGRKSYEQVLEFGDYPYSDKRSLVFTRQKVLPEPGNNIEFVSGDIVGYVRSIVESIDSDMWLVGGSEIIKVFLEHDLVDELIISIHPIILGSGIPLFANPNKEIDLKFVDSISFESGLVQVHYEVIL